MQDCIFRVNNILDIFGLLTLRELPIRSWEIAGMYVLVSSFRHCFHLLPLFPKCRFYSQNETEILRVYQINAINDPFLVRNSICINNYKQNSIMKKNVHLPPNLPSRPNRLNISVILRIVLPILVVVLMFLYLIAIKADYFLTEHFDEEVESAWSVLRFNQSLLLI